MTESAPPAAVVLRFEPTINDERRNQLANALVAVGLTTGMGLDIGHRGPRRGARLTVAVLNIAEGLAELSGAARQARDWLRVDQPVQGVPCSVELQSRESGTVIRVSADDTDEALRLLDGAVRSVGPDLLAWDGTSWRPDDKQSADSAVSAPGLAERERTVFVVHGRDKRARIGVFDFLRALGLHPIEWAEALARTGHGSPYVGDVLDAILDSGQAVVVLLTPDDVVRLRAEHADDENDPEIELAGQARPNVMFEAGMAMARFAERTILVRMGQVRTFTDLQGRHFVQLDNSSQKRLLLAQRLQAVGCKVDLAGKDWLTTGDLTPPDPVGTVESTSATAASDNSSPAQVPKAPAPEAGPARGATIDELELTGCVVVAGAGGDLSVLGKATNRTDRELTAILSATFYGADRQILGKASGSVNQLRPAAAKTFTLMTIDDLTGYVDFDVQIDTVF